MSEKQATYEVATRNGNDAQPLPIQSMAEMATAGQLLAQSGYMGGKNAGEGFLIMAACHQSKLPLVVFQQKFHFRQGRFSMSAHAMLAELVDRGGSYKLIERTKDCAALELTKDGNTYLSKITWEEALNEPFVYRGNEYEQFAELEKPLAKRTIKAKYRTERSRMQMLWSRAVSDGVVVVDPGARMAYSKEEIDDVIEAEFKEAKEPKRIDPSEIKSRVTHTHSQGHEPINIESDILEEANYCPIGGEDYQGMAWAHMPDDVLEMALESELPEITDAHRDAIRRELAARNEVV